MNIKDARIQAGVSRAEMSRQFDIPIRTLEDWEWGARVPPPYVEKMIVEKLLPPQNNYERIVKLSFDDMVAEIRSLISKKFPCDVICGGRCAVHTEKECEEKIKNWLKEKEQG